MNNKDKRVLWILNHMTLKDFEVPLLIDLGFEVFVPKKVPHSAAECSVTISYNYDYTLTISSDELEILNNFNFYDDKIDPIIKKIINKNFAVAIFPFYIETTTQLVEHFEGLLILRPFGLANNFTYTQITEQFFPKGFLKKLNSIRYRFWFGQAYENLSEIEHGIYKEKAIYLPIGIPEQFYKYENQWLGNDKKILFVCPKIKTSQAYYGKIYQDFKLNFGDLPYIVAGNQPDPVNEANVLGFVDQEEYIKLFLNNKVMFYHSQEKYHLHYHPLEAIVYGMPVIFMAGGLLQFIGGDDQPGLCKSIQQAREKILRIFNNDLDLISEIKTRQKEILLQFSKKYCFKKWQENFLKQIIDKNIQINKSAIKKIAVFLPIGYRGGSLNAAKNIAKMLHLGSQKASEPVEIIFSCIANYYDLDEDFNDLVALGIQVRETEWKVISKNEVENILQYSGFQQSFKVLDCNDYQIPTDQISNFHDCDKWILVSDRTDPPIAPIKDYIVIVYDYLQRYIPEIMNAINFNSLLHTVRSAKYVLTTTPSTQQDTIQFAGLSREKVLLAPIEFNPFIKDIRPFKQTKKYFIWPTNLSIHKNHLNAFKGLLIYYEQLEGRLECIVTGVDTDYFNNTKSEKFKDNYIDLILSFLNRHSILKEKVKFMGNLPQSNYVDYIGQAEFLFHPTVMDNGTFSVIEAAYYNVPTLSHNYPAMSYINNKFNLNINFCNMVNPSEIAKNLYFMEKNVNNVKERLPAQTDLLRFSYENLALDYWNFIRELL